MAATTAKIGFGVLLKRGDGASPTEAFTAIAELQSIQGPGYSLEVVDATHSESPDAHREKIAGLIDAGEVSAEVTFLPTDATQNFAAGIQKDLLDRTKRNFQIVWPGPKTYAFAAFVTSFQPQASISDKMTASITLAITGKVTES